MRVCNVAKLVAFLCRNKGDVSDYIHGKEGNGERVPYIEIPTSFREVYALTDSAYLTLDILSLSIEGYISLKVNPLVEPVLLRGIEIVHNNLLRYIKNPLDVTIRQKLCTAGLFTAIANIITRFGISFALSMGMNGKNRKSKSVVSSILLPHIVDYNLSVAAARFAKIARVMGKDTNNLAHTNAAQLAIEAIKGFKESIGIELYQGLGQLGLEKDDLAEAAEVAIRFEDINCIPRKASFENLMEILEKAY
jgi:alcohol dehydrogenase class IV